MRACAASQPCYTITVFQLSHRQRSRIAKNARKLQNTNAQTRIYSRPGGVDFKRHGLSFLGAQPVAHVEQVAHVMLGGVERSALLKVQRLLSRNIARANLKLSASVRTLSGQLSLGTGIAGMLFPVPGYTTFFAMATGCINGQCRINRLSVDTHRKC